MYRMQAYWAVKSFAERAGPVNLRSQKCTPAAIESCASVGGKWLAQLRGLDYNPCKDTAKDSCQRMTARWPSLGSAQKSSVWMSVVWEA
jgi:hypothetical protein